MHGKPLQLSTKSGTINNELIHVSDWFPTIMSATSCPLLNGTQPLDGHNQWDAIRGKSSSRRTEILHNIDPLFKQKSPPETRARFDVSVQAAIRSGKRKLLTGMLDQGINGWIRPPERGNCSNHSQLSEEQKAQKNRNNVKLFNIENDPYERNEVSASHPEVVDPLLSRLVEYNSSAVPLWYPPHNRLCDPKLRGGFWLPWKNKSNTPRRNHFRDSKKRRRWKKRGKNAKISKRNFYSKSIINGENRAKQLYN